MHIMHSGAIKFFYENGVNELNFQIFMFVVKSLQRLILTLTDGELNASAVAESNNKILYSFYLFDDFRQAFFMAPRLCIRPRDRNSQAPRFRQF